MKVLTIRLVNTSKGNYELFAAVAGAEGSGIPLAYCYIQTDKEDTDRAGSKQAVLESFLGALKKRGIHPEFVLTDKDWSEINAMAAVWPHAKHQLCFWHALRALKKRLAKNQERPAHYDAVAAHTQFPFIDSTFLPLSQRPADSHLDEPPTKPIPRLRLLVEGRPPVITAAPLPTIRIPSLAQRQRHNAAGAVMEDDQSDVSSDEDFDLERSVGVRGELTLPAYQEDEDEELTGGEDEEGSDAGNFWAERDERQARDEEEADEEEWEWDGDEGWSDDAVQDLRRQINAMNDQLRDLTGSADDSDAEDSDSSSEAPTAAPASTATTSNSPRPYQFCPPPHRVTILRLFGKHASQHPLLPERHGQPRTSELIYRDAVQEMYQHCEANRLCEVWAYLWQSWYSPSKWKLWARSANGTSIPVHRTTMMVESLWRNLKRLVLHMYNRPPLDLANYAIITQSLAGYRITLSKILKADSGQNRRPKKLSHMQEAFKRSWKALRNVPIKGAYKTDVTAWTCDCGAQKYHAYLLCKHLVHAAGSIPVTWWVNASRYHIPPFYTVPIDGTVRPPPESKRNHAWLSRMDSRARPERSGTPNPLAPALEGAVPPEEPQPGSSRTVDSDCELPESFEPSAVEREEQWSAA